MNARQRMLRRRRDTEAKPQDTISAQGAVMAQKVAPPGGPSHATGRASHQLVVSFLGNGRAIALLGFVLPACMLAWSLLTGASIRGSLSEYYFTPVRDLMVGILIALAVFLWSYRGFSDRDDDLRADRRVGKIAAVAATVIALFPITPRNDDRCTLFQCIIGPRSADLVHAVGAAVFFLCLALFCLVLLPRSAVSDDGAPSRIRLYRACGGVIVAALTIVVVWKFLPPEIIFALGRYQPIFWVETLAIWAFSVAWIVRGRALEGAITRNFELSQPVPAPAGP